MDDAYLLQAEVPGFVVALSNLRFSGARPKQHPEPQQVCFLHPELDQEHLCIARLSRLLRAFAYIGLGLIQVGVKLIEIIVRRLFPEVPRPN